MAEPASIDELLRRELLAIGEYAREAIQLEGQNEALSAADMYDSAVNAIVSLKPKFESYPEHMKTLLEYESMYRDRSQQLRASSSETQSNMMVSPSSASINPMTGDASEDMLSDTMSRSSFQDPEFPVNFREMHIPQCQESEFIVPLQHIAHPFFMIAKLRDTMKNGGFISPTIYVPSDVWAQMGVKFHMGKEKSLFCDQLCTLLQKLRMTEFSDSANWAKACDEFIRSSELLAAQHLNKVVPRVSRWAEGASGKKESKLSEKLWKVGHAFSKLTSTRKQSPEETPYTLCLLKLLEHSVFVLDYIRRGEAEGMSHGTMERLARVSSYFRTVVIYFVLRDFYQVVERFVRKSRESFSRLFPKDYKTPHLVDA